jgi:hypothetical protein
MTALNIPLEPQPVRTLLLRVNRTQPLFSSATHSVLLARICSTGLLPVCCAREPARQAAAPAEPTSLRRLRLEHSLGTCSGNMLSGLGFFAAAPAWGCQAPAWEHAERSGARVRRPSRCCGVRLSAHMCLPCHLRLSCSCCCRARTRPSHNPFAATQNQAARAPRLTASGADCGPGGAMGNSMAQRRPGAVIRQAAITSAGYAYRQLPR